MHDLLDRWAYWINEQKTSKTIDSIEVAKNFSETLKTSWKNFYGPVHALQMAVIRALEGKNEDADLALDSIMKRFHEWSAEAKYYKAYLIVKRETKTTVGKVFSFDHFKDKEPGNLSKEVREKVFDLLNDAKRDFQVRF